LNRDRPFVLPALGLIVLFALLGPAIGGVFFLPLAFLLAAPPALAATAHLGWFAALTGHVWLLIPAYVLGFGPAAATGLLFAIWDYAVPPNWPRALAAALIGAVLAHAVGGWLGGLAAGFHAHVTATGEDWVDSLFSPEFAAALMHALEAVGALAGLACAMAGGLLGWSGRTAMPSETVE
jgi:hypothetical protein